MSSSSSTTANPKSISFSIDSLVNGSVKRTAPQSAFDEQSKRSRSLSPRSSNNSLTPPGVVGSPFGLAAHLPQAGAMAAAMPGVAEAAAKAAMQQHAHNLARASSHPPLHPHHPLSVANHAFLGSAPPPSPAFMRPAATAFDAFHPASALHPWLLASRHPGIAGLFPGETAAQLLCSVDVAAADSAARPARVSL